MEYARLIEEISPRGSFFENGQQHTPSSKQVFLFEIIKHTEKIGTRHTIFCNLVVWKISSGTNQKKSICDRHKTKFPTSRSRVILQMIRFF